MIGAGGPTGLECVKRLAQLGRPVRAIVRNPEKYRDTFEKLGSTVSVVKGDVEAPASLREALAGVQNIIFAASGKGYFSARAVDELVRLAVVSHTSAAHKLFLCVNCAARLCRALAPLRILPKPLEPSASCSSRRRWSPRTTGALAMSGFSCSVFPAYNSRAFASYTLCSHWCCNMLPAPSHSY